MLATAFLCLALHGARECVDVCAQVMAAAGVAAKRPCEEMIAQGRVKLNGKVCTASLTSASFCL